MDTSQSASDVVKHPGNSAETESSAHEKVSVMCSQDQGAVQPSQESKQHFLRSTTEQLSLSSTHSKDETALQKSDSQISLESPEELLQQGHQRRSLCGNDSSLQRGGVHRSSSTSTDHSERPSSSTARSVSTGHGISSTSSSQRGKSHSHAEPKSMKDYCSDSSRRSSSRQRYGEDSSKRSSTRYSDASLQRESVRRMSSASAESQKLSSGTSRSSREHSRGYREDVDIKHSERLQYYSGSDGDGRRSYKRESDLQRMGHGKGSESYSDLERDRKKSKSYERSSQRSETERTNQRGLTEQRSTSSDKVVRRKQSEDVLRRGRRDTQLTQDLDRLSVNVAAESSMSKDHEEESTEYEAVLTRHVNQLFIRGDNVALVAVLG